MAVQSIILGSINGISKIDYEKLKADLSKSFEKVVWKNRTLSIQSSKKHHRLKDIAAKIADRICENEYGSLLFIGNNRVVCIYFGHKRFISRPYKEPEPPEWWEAETGKPPSTESKHHRLMNVIKSGFKGAS